MSRMPRSDSSASEERPKDQSGGLLSTWLIAIGLTAGLLLGLASSWALGALPENNTVPRQLNDDDRNHYLVAIALDYRQKGDLRKALDKLIALAPGADPFQLMADSACELASGGYMRSDSGVRALQAVAALYQDQGRTGCADAMLPVVVDAAPEDEAASLVATTDPSPLPTKTPPGQPLQPTAALRVVATVLPDRRFAPLPARTFCDPNLPALIEVYVVDYLGRGIPGQRIRVRWGNREDIFISGLKPERGGGYADFQMEPNEAYVIDMPGASAALGAELSTSVCYSGSRETLKSWRVSFRESS